MAKLNNICKKYDITKKELCEFFDFIYGKHCIGDWYGDVNVLIAATELVTSGDIEEENTQLC